MIPTEQMQREASWQKYLADLDETRANTSKLINEAQAAGKKARWYEITIAIAVVLAVATLTKLFL